MGVIKQGILGGFSGKVANVVGSSWKGIAVIKSRPLSVANPNTVGQQAQRGAMTQIVMTARLMLAALIQPYWNPFAQRMSGYNAFVKENIDTFTTAGFTTFADFFLTRGSLINFSTVTAAADSGANTVTINWVDNSGVADAAGTDPAVVGYYNETQDYWVIDVDNATRVDGTLVIADALVNAADALKVYVGCSNVAISKVSDSTYVAVAAA